MHGNERPTSSPSGITLGMRHVLRPGGALVINLFGNLEPGRDFLAASLDKTLKSVFPGVRIHANGSGNMFFVATDRAAPEFVHAPNLDGLHPDVETDAQEAYNDIVEPIPEDGRILTDDFNPAEFYDAHNRERLRRQLAAAFVRFVRGRLQLLDGHLAQLNQPSPRARGHQRIAQLQQPAKKGTQP